MSNDPYMKALRGDVPKLDPVEAAYKRIVSEVEEKGICTLYTDDQEAWVSVARHSSGGYMDVFAADVYYGETSGRDIDASNARQLATFLLAAARWVEGEA